MWALLGGLIGFLQSLAPELLKFQQDKRDKEHEITLMKLQMENAAAGRSDHMEEVRITNQQFESKALQESYRAELKYSGKYSATVRPTVTYMAMGLYLVQKVLLIYAILFAPELPWAAQNAQLVQLAAVVWTAFDETMLAWIIGFWFGSRQIKNAKG